MPITIVRRPTSRAIWARDRGVVADGASDDSAALAAITADLAANGPRPVELPTGVIGVTAPFDLPPGAILRGGGIEGAINSYHTALSRGTIFKPLVAGLSSVIRCRSLDFTQSEASHAEAILIEDVAIDADADKLPLVGLLCQNFGGIQARRLRIAHVNGPAIRLLRDIQTLDPAVLPPGWLVAHPNTPYQPVGYRFLGIDLWLSTCVSGFDSAGSWRPPWLDLFGGEVRDMGGPAYDFTDHGFYGNIVGGFAGLCVGGGALVQSLGNTVLGDDGAPDGAMSASVNPTTLAMATSQPFLAQYVDRPITVTGAGAAGADLVTTIASFTNSSTVVLALPALTTVTAAKVRLGIGTRKASQRGTPNDYGPARILGLNFENCGAAGKTVVRVRDAAGFKYEGSLGLVGVGGAHLLDLDYSTGVSVEAVLNGTGMDSTSTLGTAATTVAASKTITGLTTTMVAATHEGRIIKVAGGLGAGVDQYTRIDKVLSTSSIQAIDAIGASIAGAATVSLMVAGVYLGQGLSGFGFSKFGTALGQWTGREKVIENVPRGVAFAYGLDGVLHGDLAGTVGFGRLRAHAATRLAAGNVALHANWGTSPVIEQLSGGASAGRIGIRAKATPGANPTVVFTFPDGAWDEMPEFKVDRINTIDPEPFMLTDTTTTTVTFTYVGTPVAETIYYAQWHTFGR